MKFSLPELYIFFAELENDLCSNDVECKVKDQKDGSVELEQARTY